MPWRYAPCRRNAQADLAETSKNRLKTTTTLKKLKGEAAQDPKSQIRKKAWGGQKAHVRRRNRLWSPPTPWPRPARRRRWRSCPRKPRRCAPEGAWRRTAERRLWRCAKARGRSRGWTRWARVGTPGRGPWEGRGACHAGRSRRPCPSWWWTRPAVVRAPASAGCGTRRTTRCDRRWGSLRGAWELWVTGNSLEGIACVRRENYEWLATDYIGCPAFSSVQFRPLPYLVDGRTWQDDSTEILFQVFSPSCRRPSWAILARAGMSILWCCPSIISPADHDVAHPPRCTEGWFWRGCRRDWEVSMMNSSSWASRRDWDVRGKTFQWLAAVQQLADVTEDGVPCVGGKTFQ